MENKIINWHKMNSIVTVPNAQGDYLFYDQLEQVRERCEEIVKGKDILQHETILGIIGDRGSGKSSFLHTVKKNLSDEYCVLDIVDPSIFNNSMSIIELFVSQIYKRITDDSSSEWNSNICRCEAIHEQLREITKVLADFRAGERGFYENNTYSEVLSNVKQRVNLAQLIKKLVEDFLDCYCNREKQCKGLILCIDDVDLVSNQQIFSLLEDVRKYLAGNIIVITAFHFRQLFDAILHVKINENGALLGKNVLNVSDVREQATRYLEKLIPVQNRIELPKITKLLNQPYYLLLQGLVNDNQKDNSKRNTLNSYLFSQKLAVNPQKVTTMSEWLYEVLNARLRLKLSPVDKSEYTTFNLPQNLRGLLQFARLIVDDMECIEYDNGEVFNENIRRSIPAKLLNNLQIFENYLHRNYQEILPSELIHTIESWRATDYRVKNHFICVELAKKIENTDSEMLSTLPRYQLIQAHNITIGDVFNVLETYKGSAPASRQTHYFVYLLKVLYSIELLRNYLLACGGLESLEIYLTLVNAKLLHEDFLYFQTNSEIETSVQFNRNYVEHDINVTNLYRKLFYSNVAVNSDLRRSNPGSSYFEFYRRTSRTSLAMFRQYDTLKYQRLYDYDIQDFDTFVNGYKYPIDPLAFMGQKWYVQKTLYKNMYVFYSMFDLDAFIRFDYGRGDKNAAEPIGRLLGKIDSIITGSIKGKSRKDRLEHELVNSMSSPIFYKEIMRNNREPVFFSDSDRSAIVKLYESDDSFEKIDTHDDKKRLFTTESNKNTLFISKLSKYSFIALIDEIISSDLHLQTSEIDALKSIKERVSIKRNMVRSSERRFVLLIVNKYNYNLGKE